MRRASASAGSPGSIPQRSAPTFTSTSTSSRTPSARAAASDRKSTRLNSSHLVISYAVFCLKKKNIDLAIQIGLHRIGQHLGLSLEFVLRVGQTLLFPLEILLPLVHFRHKPFLSLFPLGVVNDSLLKIDNCYSARSR